MQSRWFKISLFNFFLAACIGALLRFAFVEEVSWLKFRFWLHGHSHVAMLGWVYLALYALVIGYFLPKEEQKLSKYNRLFWLTQLSVFGMLIFFPIQGYAGWSIAFSTLHIICSYIFVWLFWRDLNKTGISSHLSTRFTKASLFFMVLSTLAIWAIPPIIVSGHAGSAAYYAAIQFFLHFQFNGWFIFAVLGLLFKWMEQNQIVFSSKKAGQFFRLLFISCFPTYAIAVTWSNPLPILFFVNSIGVLIQFAALVLFLLLIKESWPQIKSHLSNWLQLLLKVSFLSFTLKIIIQTAVVIPYIATIAYTIRNFSIGFLHLMLLGMITCFLLAFAAKKDLWNIKSPLRKFGVSLFLIGFLGSELILFLQGCLFWGAYGFMPGYYVLLFLFSLLMPLGIGSLLIKDIFTA